ncbi:MULTISPECIES: hypothetical protein [Yersinia]|uniref:hypothetical protein n=1 Tax=Yersinia TaxID=629 RepID=UPI001D04CD66|nr:MULTISPECIES: hypothetical protein [Yersinia]
MDIHAVNAGGVDIRTAITAIDTVLIVAGACAGKIPEIRVLLLPISQDLSMPI